MLHGCMMLDVATKIHQILRQSLMCWHHCQVQLRQRAMNPRNWWHCLCFSSWCCCRKTCCLTTTPRMSKVWMCLPCFLPFYLSPFRSFVLTASHTWPTPRTRCCLSELPAYLFNANETHVGCHEDLLSFSMALFLSFAFMWIGRCQVILVVTPVSTCTQNESKGETHLCFLCSDWLIHISFHVSFDISFWFAAFDSSLLSLNLLPFLFIFSPGLYLGSHWMLVYRDCQASHWKIEPPSKWREGGHYTRIIIYHNIIIIS